MAKRKRFTRQQSFFFAFICFALGFACIISGVVSLLSPEGFNSTLFLILTISIFAAAVIVYGILSLPKVKGRIGEARVNAALKEVMKKNGGAFIHNVIVLGDDGKSSQIDHIYVGKNGVFVIETKNYAGRIYGQDQQKQWTQVLAYGHTKNKLYNPVLQNATHIYRLKEALGVDTFMKNVVVFVLGNTDFIESEHVYSISEMKKAISDGPGLLDETKAAEIIDKLKKLKESPTLSSKDHIREIKQDKQSIQEGVCPRCGGKLIERISKKDGSHFLGCSNYPNCRFTKNLHEKIN